MDTKLFLRSLLPPKGIYVLLCIDSEAGSLEQTSYTDIDDFYKYYRECESENPLYIEGEKKLAEWMDRGVTIEEYLNEDRYTCSLNFTGPQEILDEIMNWDNGIADVHHKYFLRFWDEDNQHNPVQRAPKKVNE